MALSRPKPGFESPQGHTVYWTAARKRNNKSNYCDTPQYAGHGVAYSLRKKPVYPPQGACEPAAVRGAGASGKPAGGTDEAGGVIGCIGCFS